MKRTEKLFLIILLVIGAVAAMAWWLHAQDFRVLEPKGIVATKEKHLMLFTVALSLVVVIPVFVMTAYFSLRYHEDNEAEYRPNWDGNRILESIWWGVPIILVIILGAIAWQTSHSLDPFKPLASDKKPLIVQAVALQWKWLFIYPEQKIATLNYVELPAGRPVQFQVTADAPMNGLWIPELGTQIYAMSGMSTELNLQADKPGVYRGSSSNISGQGFADMHFSAKAVSDQQFGDWMKRVRESNNQLTSDTYNVLAQPRTTTNAINYGQAEPKLYDKILLKFMVPDHEQLRADEDPTPLLETMNMHMHMEHQ